MHRLPTLQWHWAVQMRSFCHCKQPMVGGEGSLMDQSKIMFLSVFWAELWHQKLCKAACEVKNAAALKTRISNKSVSNKRRRSFYREMKAEN